MFLSAWVFKKSVVIAESVFSLKITQSFRVINKIQFNSCRLCGGSNYIAKPHTICRRQFSQQQENIQEDVKPSTKLLKISIIGTPNSGKSTFINQIVGRRVSVLDKTKVFAISKKVHTTRAKARAVLNLEDTQVVFLDTPGLVSQTESDKYNLEKAFKVDSEMSLTEAHIVCVMHDVSNSYTRGRLDPKVLRLLYLYPYKHTVLILNKVDTVKKKHYLLDLSTRLTCGTLCDIESKNQRKDFRKMSEEEVTKEAKREAGWPYFQQVFLVSALEGSGVGDVMEYLLQHAKPAEWMYPESVYTDQKPERVICDTVKSKLLEYLPQELPYACKVQIELYKELSDGTITSVVVITCPSMRCERMLLKRIRQIAKESEVDLRNTFLTQVLVKLVVQTADKKDEK